MSFSNNSQDYQCCLFNPSKNYVGFKQNPTIEPFSEQPSPRKVKKSIHDYQVHPKKINMEKNHKNINYKSQATYQDQKNNNFRLSLDGLIAFSQNERDSYSSLNQTETKDKKKLSCKSIRDAISQKFTAFRNKNEKNQNTYNALQNNFQIPLNQGNKSIQGIKHSQINQNNKNKNNVQSMKLLNQRASINLIRSYQQNGNYHYVKTPQYQSFSKNIQENQIFKKKNINILKIENLNNPQKVNNNQQFTNLNSLRSTNFYQNHDSFNLNKNVIQEIKQKKQNQNHPSIIQQIKLQKKQSKLTQSKKGDYDSCLFQSKKTKNSSKKFKLIALKSAISFDSEKFDQQSSSKSSIIVQHIGHQYHIDHLI